MLDATSSYPQSDLTPAADTSSFAPPQKRTRKVAILGFGRTAKDCPWKDPSWELWAMNGFWRAAEPDFGITAPEERYSLWLDMHTIEYTRDYGKRAGIEGKQEEWLKQPHPFPIFMLDEPKEYGAVIEGVPQPRFPSVVRFPIEDVIKALGRDYFTSTVAYALAFALAQDDVAEIGCWGIDLVHSTEYGDQRPCAEYWIGRAEERGIRLVIHEDSALLKQRGRYGYEPANPLERELRAHLESQARGIEAAIQKNQAEMERIKAQLNTDDGALQLVRSTLDRLDAWNRGGKV